MRLFSTLLVVAGSLSLASADSVQLRNGEVVQGTYLGGTARQIRVDVNGDIRSFDVGQVSSVTFADPDYRQQTSSAPDYRQQTSSAPDYRQQTSSAPAPLRRPAPEPHQGGFMIPADTAITVRMIDAVNSETARLGQTFRASIDEPVFVEGQQVIPRGADVLTKLVDDKQSGKFEGRTVLTLALSSITINGQPVDVTSSDVKTASASRGNKTAGAVGGGTALGAIVGAIAGGGKGAAIGAVSGAAIGGGAQAMTKGQQVKIPSETRLTFQLQSPVRL